MATKKAARLIVLVDLDPTPGRFHEADDWVQTLQERLNGIAPHYRPEVSLDLVIDRETDWLDDELANVTPVLWPETVELVPLAGGYKRHVGWDENGELAVLAAKRGRYGVSVVVRDGKAVDWTIHRPAEDDPSLEPRECWLNGPGCVADGHSGPYLSAKSNLHLLWTWMIDKIDTYEGMS